MVVGKGVLRFSQVSWEVLPQAWLAPPAPVRTLPSDQASPSLHCPILLQELREQCPSLLEKDTVRWVLTVPAIWKQPAKQFMREAAYLVRTCRQSCGCWAPGMAPYPHSYTTLGTTEPSCKDCQPHPAGHFGGLLPPREGVGL